jgi:hypothetical protein
VFAAAVRRGRGQRDEAGWREGDGEGRELALSGVGREMWLEVALGALEIWASVMWGGRVAVLEFWSDCCCCASSTATGAQPRSELL